MLENLTCNSCGAPIEVPDSANFVTCNHCACQLAVRRLDNVTFTEELNQLAQRTEKLSEQVDRLSLQNEIVALDREWELARDKWMVRNKNGTQHVPSKSGAIVGGVVVTVFGCFWTAMAVSTTSFAVGLGGPKFVSVVFPLFGLLFIAVGIGACVSGWTKADRYRRVEQEYHRRRSNLLERIRHER